MVQSLQVQEVIILLEEFESYVNILQSYDILFITSSNKYILSSLLDVQE